jgi:hypothetical protein
MPKVALDAGFGVVALLMPDHQHRLVVEPRQPADHGMVVGKGPVACQAGEFGEQLVDVVLAMRPVRVPRHLALLPGRQVLVEIAQRRIRLAVQRLGLLRHVHAGVGLRHRAKLFRLAFDVGEGLFEIEILHGASFSGPHLYARPDCVMQLGTPIGGRA